MSLARILDDGDSVAAGDPSERAHVRELPVEVSRHQEPGAFGQRGLDGAGVEVVVRLARVDDDRLPACLRDCLERGDEGICRDDDLVARFDAGGDEPEAQGVQAARDSDAMRRYRSTPRTPTRTPRTWGPFVNALESTSSAISSTICCFRSR